jgi:hypothetical protein
MQQTYQNGRQQHQRLASAITVLLLLLSMVAVEDVLGVNCHRGAICLINYFSFQIYLNKNEKTI